VQAIKDRASDIHIEPFEKLMRLRYRVDGSLLDKTPPPKNLAVPLVSRLKIMSSLDIAEPRLPQDARMRVKVAGRDFDMRVSFLPTVRGEKCVLRILDKSNLSASMDKIGMEADTYRRFRAAFEPPHGLLLATAPTGHQGLSTMHCNDAAGAVARLDDMGIAPFLISSSVILACAQRLVRKICPACREPVSYPPSMYRDLGIPPNHFEGVILHRGR